MTEHGTFAVWSGRFQPPHIGHFAILSHSVATLRIPHVTILVAAFAGASSTGSYGRLADHAYAAGKNPLTPWERFTLMRLGLHGYDLHHQVQTSVAPRHDLDWELVKGFYPAKRLVCLTAKDDFEIAKAEVWRSRGEQVHIFEHITPGQVLTTTEIRNRVSDGEDWRHFLPQACHEYFVDIDGPRRVFPNT